MFSFLLTAPSPNMSPSKFPPSFLTNGSPTFMDDRFVSPKDEPSFGKSPSFSEKDSGLLYKCGSCPKVFNKAHGLEVHVRR